MEKIWKCDRNRVRIENWKEVFMKKVLIIGHFWPYHQGGSKRILGLAKYLAEFGWKPTILTGKLNSGKPEIDIHYIETESGNRIAQFKRFFGLDSKKSIQAQMGISAPTREKEGSLSTRLVKMVEAVVTYPDTEIAWKTHAMKAVEKLMVEHKYDAVLSVWPITAHMIGHEIHKKYGVPWFVDFPDMWAFTYAYRYGEIRRYFDKRLERKTMIPAKTIVTSSWPQSRLLEKLHKRERIHTIKMGYDPEYENNPPIPLTDKFTITYTGVLYGKERNPYKFFEALASLIRKRLIDPKDVDVRFYGKFEDWVQEDIERHGLQDIVKQYGSVSWMDCLQRQRESQLLLQLNWEDPKEKGAYSGKIAEYLAAFRPVISVGGFGKDVMEELFIETNVGAYCIDVSETETALLNYYNEFKTHGFVDFKGTLNAITSYSYREMAGQFAKILNQVEEGNQC